MKTGCIVEIKKKHEIPARTTRFQHVQHDRGLNDIAATDVKMVDGRKMQETEGLVEQEQWKDAVTKDKGGEDVRERKHNGLKSSEDIIDLVPPDGGWGWMVAVGSFLVTVRSVMVYVGCGSVSDV